MRIVAGAAKGRQLRVPAKGTRPTSEKVREAVFSRLDARGFVDGTTVLDLFAGSGALALEALSRGAARAVAVDSSSQAVAAIKDNARAVGLALSVIRAPVDAYLAYAPDLQADVAFLDPPYAFPDRDLAVILHALLPVLVDDAMVVVERSSRSAQPAFPDDLLLQDVRQFGDTTVYMAQVTPHMTTASPLETVG
ncbi:MAG: RsmD family RNA methyltransferase [Actinomycetaceae bacterium]|nr:RsmD family RNA methyltransferase [Actinomycetaceae bacterium]MDY6083318.1 RsmD family RNA methyltransferase [Actinomycetaceae bacterium]